MGEKFSVLWVVCAGGKGNINVPIKAFNAPETWARLLTTFERDNPNEQTRKIQLNLSRLQMYLYPNFPTKFTLKSLQYLKGTIAMNNNKWFDKHLKKYLKKLTNLFVQIANVSNGRVLCFRGWAEHET